jgi:WD40 repeat protein
MPDERALDAYVVAVLFNRAGDTLFAPAGDGKIYIAATAAGLSDCKAIAADKLGQVVCAAPDHDARHILVGTDDGRLLRIAPDGAVDTLSASNGRWIDTVASHPHTGLRAFSCGKTVRILDADGADVAALPDLVSTPSGLAFSPDGKQLAAARYNGVTVWDVTNGALLHDLFWRGSHTAIAWSGDGRHIATATQDRELHCWRLSDERDFRMSGYSAKVRSLQWTADSAYICASGADTLTSWYCGDDGPAGKPPLEFGHVFNGTVTFLAPHPALCQAAAGYSDGSVLIGDIRKGDAIIAKAPGDGGISAIAWAPDGRSLAAGTEDGTLTLMRLAAGRIEV